MPRRKPDQAGSDTQTAPARTRSFRRWLVDNAGTLLLLAGFAGLTIYDRKTIMSELREDRKTITKELQKHSENIFVLKTAIAVIHDEMKGAKRTDRDPVGRILEGFKAELLKELPTKEDLDRVSGDLAKEIELQGNLLRGTESSIARLREDVLLTAVSQKLSTAAPHKLAWPTDLVMKAPTTNWTSVVAAWDIKVHEGNLTLRGTAPDEGTRDRLVNAAATVPGVRKVEADIKIEKKE